MGGRSVAIALPVLQGRVTRRQLQGGRFNRPNDVICHSNGCLYFTDPEKRRPYQERQIPGPAGEDNLWDGARVYCLAPDGGLSVLANSRARAVAGRAYNVRREHALLAIYPRDRLDAAGNMVGRSIFADLNEGSEPGITDGLKVDSIRRVYCTGPGGIWVIAPEGRRIGVIRWPQQAVNFAFGGPDLRTLFCCAHSSVYTLRVKVSGIRIPGTSDAGSNLTTRPVAVSQADRPRCRAPAPAARTDFLVRDRRAVGESPWFR